MDMKIGYLVIWCTLSAVALGDDDTEEIWCTDSDVRSQKYLVKKIRSEEMLCEAESTQKYPWTFGEPQETPPPPESMSLKYFTYKSNRTSSARQIAVNVSWVYKRQFLKYVTQYHIEMNPIEPSGDTKQFLMKWDGNLTSVIKDSSATFVKFNFVYAGKPSDYHIHPKDEYRFKIQGCPIYLEADVPQYMDDFIKIPGCEENSIGKTEPCKTLSKSCRKGFERRGRKCRKIIKKGLNVTTTRETTTAFEEQSTMDFTAEQPGKEIHIILLMIGGVIIVLIIIIMICLFRRQKRRSSAKQEPMNGKRRVLLVSTTDERFIKVVNQLISMLKKFSHLDVICNLRERNEIGRLSIEGWTAQQIGDADLVAFLVANPYEVTKKYEGEETENSRLNMDSMEQRQVGIVMKAAEKICLNSKKEMDQKPFLVIDLGNCLKKENAPYFKHLKFPEDLKKFLRMASGSSTDTNVSKQDKKVFNSYLCIAQNVSQDTITTGYDENTRRESKGECGDVCYKQNKLDVSYIENEKTYSPNIMLPDGPLSCESNQSYKTSDFNDDLQLERYRQAGAIPKSAC